MMGFLNKKIDNVTVAAFLVASFSLLSRILGVLRDRMLAGHFGVGDELDIYYAAFRIPDLLFNLLVLGALSAGFIPVFTGLIGMFNYDKMSKEANDLVSAIINWLSLVLIGLGFLGFIFAPWLLKIITPGFGPEKLAMTVQLTRVMFLSPILLGLSSVLGGVLQSYKKFFVYSLAPIFYNLGIIAAVIFAVPIYGVYALAWGVVIGAGLHLLVQVPAVWQLGWRWHWSLPWTDKNVLKIFKMTTARTLSLAINQINLIVTTSLASLLAVGSLTVFNLANNLQSFPIGIFGISFAIAVFPALSACAFNRQQLIERFSKTFRQIMFFMIPATGLFIALRSQIVRVALGSGQFNWEHTQLTMDAMALFAVSFFAQATIPLLVRVFYARHDSKTPFYVGLVSVVVNIAGAWWFGQSMGAIGLAAAFSVSSIVNFIMLWLVLRTELENLDEGRIIQSIFKFSVASAVALVFIQLVKVLVAEVVNMNSFLGVATQVVIATIVGTVVYLIITWLLRSEEFLEFKQSIVNRGLAKKFKGGEDQSEARGI
ncbi:murein biosynthesis integral membrane protein MurJ [Candidatus Falkowbacteria bacterium CG10_big_fil_rev_8_21_14_0_10_37_14]|uniref:Probable lipid II flippase MurJ n=1 Tax=Candidatus Falkowbacteria bacterium CG10_big_fil_rev_8_21_14_0_10_37_14 TaxID=1974561 RepID=A0A2M6WSA0_9BACT|nr:murein biosynthesis integral membrane protein MurJ [Candidatus Falkowbacteria bacterium]PIT95651.1 MAG: murein biosynthesis integral membrane protein MurJ [Candidatus Falkowbacteria bacterium CG10_big_fil_rev_8_21_14_0_10_37_14]